MSELSRYKYDKTTLEPDGLGGWTEVKKEESVVSDWFRDEVIKERPFFETVAGETIRLKDSEGFIWAVITVSARYDWRKIETFELIK